MDLSRRRESVCRSLFGPVDHEQLRRDLRQKLREMSEEDSHRWNFNFETETPLVGRFEWEETPADRVVAFYVQPELKDGEEDGDRTGTDQENCSIISNTHKHPLSRRRRTHSKTAAKPTNNARITDYFAKRRRMTETKSILNPVHTSPSETALCKTIR